MGASNFIGSKTVSKLEPAKQESTSLEYHIVVGVNALGGSAFSFKKESRKNYVSHGIVNPNKEVKPRFNDGVVLKEDYLYCNIAKIRSQNELSEKLDHVSFAIQRKLNKYALDKRYKEVHVHIFVMGAGIDKLVTDLFYVITEEKADTNEVQDKVNKLLSSSTYIKGNIKDINVECIQCIETTTEKYLEKKDNDIKTVSEKESSIDLTKDIHVPQTIDFQAGIYMCQHGYESINLRDGKGTYSIAKTSVAKRLEELGNWHQIQKGSEFDIFSSKNPEIWDDMICDASGFFSQLFHTKRGGKDIYAFCTSGTQMLSIKDWFSNFSQGLTGLAPQYTRSVQIAKKLDRIVGESRGLFFVGHSLGGGLASNNALITDKRHAITYNAAGLSFMRVKATLLLNNDVKSHQWLFNVDKRKEKIHPFIIRGEVLNSVLSILGQRAYGDDPQVIMMQQDKERTFINKLNVFKTCYNSLKKHGATNFFESYDENKKPIIDTLNINKK